MLPLSPRERGVGGEGHQSAVFGQQLLFAFDVLRVQGDASHRAHLDALGFIEVTDAFGALASVHPVCARVSSLLHHGHLISESLVPLEDVAPMVVRCILDAHRDGLPVNESMMRIADDLRASSFAHIQSRIAEVAVRSTTPLVLCTLPSFLLIGIAREPILTLSLLYGFSLILASLPGLYFLWRARHPLPKD